MSNWDTTPGKDGGRTRKQRRTKEFKELGINRPARTAYHEDLESIKLIRSKLPKLWESFQPNIARYHRYSKRQILFAYYYAGNNRTNKSAAYVQAGYSKRPLDKAYEEIKRIMNTDGMEELIRAFEQENRMSARIGVDEVVAYFKDIADRAMEAADYANANRAMENLAKWLQMFVTKTEITHKTVTSKEDLDERIATYQRILAEAAPEVDKALGITQH